MESHAESEATGSPAAFVLPAAQATQEPPEACWFSAQVAAAHRESEHTPDTHSAAAAHASPSAVHAAVHESTEPVEPVNMSVVVAEPVSQQRVLLMLLSLNILLKVVTFETSQHDISWSKEDSLNILPMRVTNEVSHAEIS